MGFWSSLLKYGGKAARGTMSVRLTGGGERVDATTG